MNRKLLIPIIMAGMLLGGCTGGAIKVNPDKEKYVVGIAQFVDHPALNSATNGFKNKLTELLNKEGRQVEYIDTNATGDIKLTPNIASTLVSKDVDLILANATPCVSATYNSTTYIPILGTSVTDYGVAIKNEMKDGASGTNVSGTSDLAPLDVQVEEMLKLVPSANKVGILYCSNEANSTFQVKEVKKHLEAKGKSVKEYAFSQASEIQAVCNTINDDVVYIPTDNTCAEKANMIDSILGGKNIPIYAGEEGICKGCGFATLSIDYTVLGEITGEMAFKVLLGKEDIRTMKIQYDQNPVKKYDIERCQKYGINVPEDYEPFGLEPVQMQ